MIEKIESNGEGSFVVSSSDKEGLKTHNVSDKFDGGDDWLARFFYDGEVVSNVGVNNGGSERRYARRVGKQLVLQGLNEGSPAASISYRFGISNGAVFTIFRGGYGAEMLANKLTLSVFYEKDVMRRCSVNNFVEIRTITGSKGGDCSLNKMHPSSNIEQVRKEIVVENGVTNSTFVMVNEEDENSNRRADCQKVQEATENQLVLVEGWTGLNKRECEKFGKLLMGLKMTSLDSKGKRGEGKRKGSAKKGAEVYTLSRVRNNNVIQLIGYGQGEGNFYLVLEHLPKTLEAELQGTFTVCVI
ncbi:hypothetical protein LguiA_022532 [Lonicera macranthoides]